ncbi:MAG: iron-sulfur cluster assembly protein [Bacteroidota bacterium]
MDTNKQPMTPTTSDASTPDQVVASTWDKPLPNEDIVVGVLRTIYDPEIPVNIYDLGLIYEVNIRPNGVIHILMTLTAPNCPVAGTFPKTIEDRLCYELEIADAVVELTFDPPYEMSMMSEAAKLELGFL